jgi:hypothetical protein
VSVFLNQLFRFAPGISAALMMCRRSDLYRLITLDGAYQRLLPMKQLLGGTHLGR